MSKKKHFHGTGGKGGLVRQMAFFYRSRPGGTRSGMPQPKVKKAPASVAALGEGRVEQNFIKTVSTSNITENGGFVK